MGKENIEKYSARYALLKRVAGFWHHIIFYRKVIVLGVENINPGHHLIFAPNHQNALMDALAVLFTHKGQPVFLARADIFKRKLIANILYFLKLLPVYRIRDGFSTLKSNDEVFLKTIDVIRNKNGLVILPEGDHAGFRRLRQLKKGICRVAFQADEATGFGLKIKIIPVGIEFSNYTRFRQVLTVVYGKPIEVSEYHQLYREAPERALNELRRRLSCEIKRVMVHIESVEDYEAIDELRSIVNGKYSDDIRNPKVYRDRILIEKLNKLKASDPEKYSKICLLSLAIKEKTKLLNINYRLLRKKKHSPGWLIAGIALLTVTFPLWLFGNIFTLTFLTVPGLQIKKIKDPQFHSSVKYGMSLVLAMIFLPIYLIICLLIFSPWWLAILIFLLIPVSGIFAWNYNILFHRITGGFRIRKYDWEKNPDFLLLRKEHNELLTLIAGLNDEE
ncbi:MAG: 1-acyl-sn-glycerol-3-phosphate acyltransferase [Bacteroidales bacterium]|jgi:1-acyl-sn-glycerol-3-phosphate acyltransferase|nr:1-acyl-sn-glycerol-3-phosphate acyltransferase [Bacteroidales bacterium]